MIKQPSIATIKRDRNLYVDLPPEEKLTRRRFIICMISARNLRGICSRAISPLTGRIALKHLREMAFDNWSLVEHDIFEWLEAAK